MSDFNSKLEAILHWLGGGEYNKAKRFRKRNGYVVHGGVRVHSMDMGEAIKYFLNVGGIAAFIFGFLANLGNFVSVALGVVGFLYGCAKAAKMYEDYRFRKVERMEKEHHVKKLIKRRDE